MTMHQTRNDLREETRRKMIELLNQQLADASDLYSHTKQAHWNVKGMQFIALHELFDKLAGEVAGFVDLIAERATALGGDARGTLRMAASASKLPEYPDHIYEGSDHVKALADRYARFGASSRAAIETAIGINDTDTADLFTEISRAIDKNLWFLEAHLQS